MEINLDNEFRSFKNKMGFLPNCIYLGIKEYIDFLSKNTDKIVIGSRKEITYKGVEIVEVRKNSHFGAGF